MPGTSVEGRYRFQIGDAESGHEVKGVEVFVRRYDAVARISYSGDRAAKRQQVENADVARLLAENLLRHL